MLPADLYVNPYEGIVQNDSELIRTLGIELEDLQQEVLKKKKGEINH